MYSGTTIFVNGTTGRDINDIWRLSMIWFMADLHIGHRNIINFTQRKYSDLLDMETSYTRNINSKVLESDTLVLVGDICFGGKSEWIRFLSRINCKNLILVKGNHDAKVPREFQLVTEYYAFKVGKTIVTVSHYPRKLKWRFRFLLKPRPRYFHRMLPDSEGWHIHGHTHSQLMRQYPRQIHVGADATGGYPVSLSEITNLISKGD